ncbi:MAG: PD-(D/E)XK nuclease family protein [bacterium]
MADKYSAVWVSHSSMGDFIKCPRLYYLHNVYKNPKTGKKINLVSPALSLGSAVHEVVEGLAEFPAEKRFENPSELLERFEKTWEKFSGKKGGFRSEEEELEYKARGKAMIERVIQNPGPLKEKIIKLKEGSNGMLPNFYLSEKENIILCGRIDWLEYKPEDDSVHILDFKTSRQKENGDHEENEESLQLPIYQLLLKHLQKRKVSGASYWYLDVDDRPKEKTLPSVEDSYEKVYKVAKAISDARALAQKEGPEKVFVCPRGEAGCFGCAPFEKIIRGEAEFLGVGEWGQEMYLV